MPSVVLAIIPAPSEERHNQPHQGAGPLFRGNGDTDYLCGNCGFVVASGMGPTQRVPYDSTSCPACGATNEFPAELRS